MVEFDYLTIPLANTRRGLGGHKLIGSITANDRNFAAPQAFTDGLIGRDVPQLVAVDEIVSLIGLSSRQAVLFDQLCDLRLARFLVRLLNAFTVQFLIARDFGELSLLRRELSAGGRGTFVLRQLLPFPLLLPHLPFGFLGLLLIGQARL